MKHISEANDTYIENTLCKFKEAIQDIDALIGSTDVFTVSDLERFEATKKGIENRIEIYEAGKQ